METLKINSPHRRRKKHVAKHFQPHVPHRSGLEVELTKLANRQPVLPPLREPPLAEAGLDVLGDAPEPLGPVFLEFLPGGELVRTAALARALPTFRGPVRAAAAVAVGIAATTIAVGVASPSAQGQATTRTAVQAEIAVDQSPASAQPTNVASAASSTNGTKTPTTRSAIR